MACPPLPADHLWMPALSRWCAADVTVLGRRTLSGGYASGGVVAVDLDVGGQRLSVAIKRGAATEAAALRAVAVVPELARPRLIVAGRDNVGDWLMTPLYQGAVLQDGDDVPEAVWEALARVHAHWMRRRPRGLPVVTSAWWRELCEGRIGPAVRAAAQRCPDPTFEAASSAVTAWAADPRIVGALTLLPKTLVHGDAHRGNVLIGAEGPTIIDWGNAKVAPAGLDGAVLRAQGATEPDCYRAHLAERVGASDPRLVDVERHWADVHVHIAYLGFAADHLGAPRVAEMIDTAAAAVADLGRALSVLR